MTGRPSLVAPRRTRPRGRPPRAPDLSASFDNQGTVAASVPYAPERTRFLPDEVALVVEVVSAESEDRDRRYKPTLYADAGIRHFWRIEDEKGNPAVHTYELDDTTRTYVATGVHRDRLELPVPFKISVDVAALAR